MELPFVLPPLEKGGALPVWQEDGFFIGSKKIPVLEYAFSKSGWNDDLTLFHEDTAGSEHFMDQASRRYALYQTYKYMQNISNPVMLEVGCSSGFLLEQLCKQFPQACIIGSDVIRNTLYKIAESFPSIPLLCFDLVHCPLPDNCCDVIVLLNVLEHIENDTAAMRQIYRILKPGGIAVIEVPAGAQLFDSYDTALMHCRRYSLASLRNLARLQGLQILSKSHLGCFLYPGFWMVKRFCKNRFAEVEIKQKEKVARRIKNTSNSRLCNLLMQIEFTLGNYVSYPFGIRCVMTCMKPKKC